MSNLSAKFDRMYTYLKSDAFLSMSALGGELAFYISSYNPKDEFEVSGEIERVIKRLRESGIGVVDVNLFSLALEILNKEGLLEPILAQEGELNKGELLDVLGGALDAIKYIVPAIKEKIKEQPDAKMVVIYGIGAVYPFLRSHIVLNNLQTAINQMPVLMFFPGIYSGNNLKLFGIGDGDNHYRAFDINILLEEKR